MKNKTYKPIYERIKPNQKINKIEEKNENDQYWYIQGIYAVKEEENENNRYYKSEPLEQAINLYKSELIENEKGNRAIGELGHPKSEEEYVEINHDRIGHKITELNWNGNYLYGKSRISKSLPKGSTVIGLLEDGYPFGISLRSFGDTEEGSGMEIVTDLYILCWDLVHDPGFGENAMLDAVLENKRFIIDKGENSTSIKKAVNNLEESVNNIPKKEHEKQEYFKQLMEKYFNDLNKYHKKFN